MAGTRETVVRLDGLCEGCLGQQRNNGGGSSYLCNWINFKPAFFLGPVFFRTALLCSGGYHLERGGMPLG